MIARPTAPRRSAGLIRIPASGTSFRRSIPGSTAISPLGTPAANGWRSSTTTISGHRKECLEEILQVVEEAAGPAHQAILRSQRRILETHIGIEEIRAGRTWQSGLSRILRKGSLPYLASRPLVRLGRGIRDRVMRL